MVDDDTGATRVRWARLRFSIIGPLLSAPPDTGELWAQIEALAARNWRHPTTSNAIRFSAKTIERWFYTARNVLDPIKALERRVPKHAGTFPSINDEDPERDDSFLLTCAHDIAHAPRLFSTRSMSRPQLWPLLGCPSLAGFGCPLRG